MNESLLDMFNNLNQGIIKNPSSTFYARIDGNALMDEGIEDGDIVIVDKSLDYEDGDLVVCVIEEDFALRFIDIQADGDYLVLNDDSQPQIKIDPNDELQIWGVVIFTIKKNRKRRIKTKR